jgi:hypothetical protein
VVKPKNERENLLHIKKLDPKNPNPKNPKNQKNK